MSELPAYSKMAGVDVGLINGLMSSRAESVGVDHLRVRLATGRGASPAVIGVVDRLGAVGFDQCPSSDGLSGLGTLGPILTLRARSRTREGSLLQFRHD